MKNLTKKWWFWLIIVIVIIAIIAGGKSKKSDTDNSVFESIELTKYSYTTDDTSLVNKIDIDVQSSNKESDGKYSTYDEAYAVAVVNSGVDSVDGQINFVIDDTSVVTVREVVVERESDYSRKYHVHCAFYALKDGSTSGHFESKDGKTKSGSVVINVRGISDIIADEKKAADKETLEALEGKSLSEAQKTVKDLGVTATYIHGNSGLDFTKEIKAYDKEQIAKYVITAVKVDSDNNVEFTINTKENISEQEKADKTRETLSKKISVGAAWVAAKEYGLTQYPYGFKLHYVAGCLAEDAVDENTWFLKATCTVTNEYGASRQYECECNVTGTDDNPKVKNFKVY